MNPSFTFAAGPTPRTLGEVKKSLIIATQNSPGYARRVAWLEPGPCGTAQLCTARVAATEEGGLEDLERKTWDRCPPGPQAFAALLADARKYPPRNW